MKSLNYQMVLIQCQIFKAVAYHKKHEALRTNDPFNININIIINRLEIKIKDGYKLELETLRIIVIW